MFICVEHTSFGKAICSMSGPAILVFLFSLSSFNSISDLFANDIIRCHQFSRKKPGLGPFKEGEYKLVWRSRVQSFVLSTVGYMRVAGEVYIASVYDSVVSC